MYKLFNINKKDNKSLTGDIDNNHTYTVEIGKGMLGLELEIFSDKYCIIDVTRKELKEIINLNDHLIKINNKCIQNMPLNKFVRLCKNLRNKKKKIEIMKSV
jgi:hypothetical protein